MTQKILLTGATGFIGRHLAETLCRQKQHVRCLVRSQSNIERLQGLDVEFAYGDVFDRASLAKAVEGCDVIFHLAGQVRARNPAEFMRANAEGTRNLAQAACAVQTTSAPNNAKPLLVYVSSLAAAGPTRHPEQGEAKRESDMPCPISSYGRSKWAAEQCLAERADEIPCSIVRPGIVFGEGDMMNLELFQTIQRLGFCPVPGWRDKYYSWIHVADLVDLLLRVAERSERLHHHSFTATPDDATQFGQGVYFASAGQGISLSDIGKKIGHALGRTKTGVLRCPPVGVWGVATFYEALQCLTGRPQPYDWAKAAESLHHWCCSSEKARQQLGFEPEKSLEERFAQTAAWYKEQGLV